MSLLDIMEFKIGLSYRCTKVGRPENQVLSGGKHRTVGVSFLLRSCCHKKTHRDHYDSGKQQESLKENTITWNLIS